MGAPANSVWLPPLLLMAIAMTMALAPLATAQQNETANSSEYSNESSSSSSTTSRPNTDNDMVVAGDLSKGARVEELEDKELDNDAATPKSSDGEPYDVIDVMAATSAGVGQPKSGQTTRIYTTGEVNDEFWLKHLGDDFKHAIHLQVGGTNEDYNRIVNQTSNGVHEEVHHEYLPGAERPPEVGQQQQQQQQGFDQPNLVSQLSLDGEAMRLKDNYLRQQYPQSYPQQSMRYSSHNNNNNHISNNINNNSNNNRRTYPHMHTQHNTEHTHTHTHSHTHTRIGKPRQALRTRYKPNYGQQQQQQQDTNPTAQQPQSSAGYINSSEDTLHASPSSQAASTAARSPGASPTDVDSGQLPFKSPFNDYGSRPTRDLTYLLYKRGL